MIRQHIFVGSSNVESARYNTETKMMDVWFKKGAPYRYFAFPEEKFDMWTKAESAGAFLAAEIARKFQCVRLACSKCNEFLDLSNPFVIFIKIGDRKY